jgi:hypothetical protein
MLEMKTIVKQSPVGENREIVMAQQNFLYPLEDDAGCSYEYSNQLIQIGSNYEFMDAPNYSIGHGAYGDVFRVS